MPHNWDEMQSEPFSRLGARERAQSICDAGTFRELLGPGDRLQSPHLIAMGQTPQFDDGIVVGLGRVGSRRVVFISQDGRFIGGAIGEINGTKMLTALRLAIRTHDESARRGFTSERDRLAVLISFDTGGVRLQEANAGLLAHAEVMDQLQEAKERFPVIGLIGGSVSCFGGMGFVAASLDALIISETGRLGLTGPGVIEEVVGKDEFDAANRAQVWRTTGGRHRYIMRDVDFLVADSIAGFRRQLLEILGWPFARLCALRKIGSPQLVEEEMRLVDLASRLDVHDAADLWRAFGNLETAALADSPLAEFLRIAKRRPRSGDESHA